MDSWRCLVLFAKHHRRVTHQRHGVNALQTALTRDTLKYNQSSIIERL